MSYTRAPGVKGEKNYAVLAKKKHKKPTSVVSSNHTTQTLWGTWGSSLGTHETLLKKEEESTGVMARKQALPARHLKESKEARGEKQRVKRGKVPAKI